MADDGQLTADFVEQWRANAYGCFSSGHKFCREVCPVMQVTRNENHTPTAFHANIVAMEKGLLDVDDVADDYVHCTQCGACELRCPNTLFTGDFYRHRTRTVDVVKAMRALMVATGNEREGWKLVERAPRRAPQRAGAGRRAGLPGARRRLGRGARHPGRRRDDPVRRLRGGLLPHLVHARVRAAAAEGGRRVRPDARAVVLRRAGGRDGLRRPRPPARRPQRRRLARGRREAHHRARPARLHRLHRGLPALLRRRTTSSRSCSASSSSTTSSRTGRIPLTAARRARRHLPRPVPAEQAQGRPRGAARAAAGGARAHLQRRRPRHPVVVLLGRRRRAAGREAGDHRGDQPPARRPRAGARGRHARQRLPVVGAAAVAAPAAAAEQPLDVVDLFELVAQSAGIEVGGHTQAPARRRRGHDRRLQERRRRRRSSRSCGRSSATPAACCRTSARA